MAPTRRLGRPATLALAATFLLGAAVTLRAATAPLEGYEQSVLLAVRPLLWLLFVPLVALYALALWNLRRDARPVETGVVIAAIMYVNLVVLALPAFRGYHFNGRSDAATILGRIRYIADTGAIGPDNVYPATHLVTVSVTELAGIDLPPAMFIIPFVFTALFPLFTYCYATRLFDRRLYVGVACLASTVLLLSYRHAYVLFDQQVMALLFVPVTLYAVYRSLDAHRRYYVVLALTGTVLAVFHPVTVLLFLFTLVAFLALDHAGGISGHHSTTPPLTIGAVVGIAMLQWFTYIKFFHQVTLRLSSFLTGRLSHRALERNVDAIAGFQPEAFLTLLAKTLLHDLLFCLLAGATILAITARVARGTRRFQAGEAVLVLWFLIATVVQVGHVATGIFNLFIYRFVGPIVIVTPLLVAAGLALFERRPSRPAHDVTLSTTAVMVLFAVLVVSAPVGLLSAHAGPYNHNVNEQVTESELATTQWVIETTPAGGRTTGVVTRPYRFADILIGPQERKDTGLFFRRGFRVPPQFGYTTATSDTTIESGSVVFVSEADRFVIRRGGGRWTDYHRADYARFQRDPRAVNHYSSGVTDLWRVD